MDNGMQELFRYSNYRRLEKMSDVRYNHEEISYIVFAPALLMTAQGVS